MTPEDAIETLIGWGARGAEIPGDMKTWYEALRLVKVAREAPPLEPAPSADECAAAFAAGVTAGEALIGAMRAEAEALKAVQQALRNYADAVRETTLAFDKAEREHVRIMEAQGQGAPRCDNPDCDEKCEKLHGEAKP